MTSRARRAGVSALVIAAALTGGSLTACTSEAGAEVAVGDCLRMNGPPDRPEVTPAECGSDESNYTVVAVVSGGGTDTDGCPADVDSYYSKQSAFSDESTTICLDVDWVVGGCMSIESGRDPQRVRCDDTSVPARQRAIAVMRGEADAGACVSGLGYAYEARGFTVCVEDMS
ncbi:LppU family putative lipoprotein [Mycolicibacterium vaccae]|uniref:LppU family putative lipoprotein n=1 Tax=Mycolicibacterium vaccae TaxID=1810 RepID=UPI003CECFADB